MFDGWEAQVSVVARIAFAMLLGGVIGLEREIKDRPAGFRTHTLLDASSDRDEHPVITPEWVAMGHQGSLEVHRALL